MPGIPNPSIFAMLQSNGELDVYNFQNDNPILYTIAVPVSSIFLNSTGDPPLFNISLATIPTLRFDGQYLAIGYYLPKMSSLQNGPVQSNLGN
jgi:hypothetical protein